MLIMRFLEIWLISRLERFLKIQNFISIHFKLVFQSLVPTEAKYVCSLFLIAYTLENKKNSSEKNVLFVDDKIK